MEFPALYILGWYDQQWPKIPMRRIGKGGVDKMVVPEISRCTIDWGSSVIHCEVCGFEMWSQDTKRCLPLEEVPLANVGSEKTRRNSRKCIRNIIDITKEYSLLGITL
jgi:hypothetical protein